MPKGLSEAMNRGTENTMTKRKKDTRWSTKQHTQDKRTSNMKPTKICFTCGTHQSFSTILQYVDY